MTKTQNAKPAMNDERTTMNNDRRWRLSRQVSLSVIVQLIFLGSLILGSWVNLQRQLDLLQHDVSILLASQEKFQQKLETLSAQSISFEYRLRMMEKQLAEGDISAKTY
jgi:hypothetical protein